MINEVFNILTELKQYVIYSYKTATIFSTKTLNIKIFLDSLSIKKIKLKVRTKKLVHYLRQIKNQQHCATNN